MDSGGQKSSGSGFFSSIASGVRNWGSAVHKSVNGRSQKQFGLVKMHLEDGASWFTGQILTSHSSNYPHCRLPQWSERILVLSHRMMVLYLGKILHLQKQYANCRTGRSFHVEYTVFACKPPKTILSL